MKPRNPDYEASVAAIFRAAPFVADLGIELVGVAAGRVESRLALATRHLQQDGLVHAAVQTAIADHTAGAAAYTMLEADQIALSVSLNVSLLRVATGDELRCRASVLRAGKRMVVAESEVYARASTGAEVMVAKATVTLAVLQKTELVPAARGAR
jgi:uncharacterized protein (TIGR00369 family)